MNHSFPSWPNFTKEEVKKVGDVLQSNKVNYWTGNEGREFEKEFAQFAQTDHAIAVANGTVALDLVLHGLGIGSVNGGSRNNEVIVTPRSFMASVSTVINAGAIPVFAEVDKDTGNISPETVAPLITKQTKAILCVHLAGWPCDMDGFRDLIGQRDIMLIEDCAQAHGATYKNRPVGGLGDVAAWSFCQDKIMTTGGEGGMVTCHDPDLWKRMWAYKDHGKSWDAVYNKKHLPGFRWLHESFGTNWRLTEMQSAIGRIQLNYLPTWHKKRTHNANRLMKVFSEIERSYGTVRAPNYTHANNQTHLPSQHAWYKFYVYLQTNKLPKGLTRDKILDTISSHNIPVFQGSCSEIYKEKAFKKIIRFPEYNYPIANELGRTSLMFLVHPTLKEEHISYMENILQEVFFNINSM